MLTPAGYAVIPIQLFWGCSWDALFPLLSSRCCAGHERSGAATTRPISNSSRLRKSNGRLDAAAFQQPLARNIVRDHPLVLQRWRMPWISIEADGGLLIRSLRRNLTLGI